MCEFRPTSYANYIPVIAQEDNIVAINGSIEVDLTGQVASESVGNIMRSGTGGQLDFVIGAFWSKGGRAINLVPATTMNDTVSSIVPYLAQGARVTVPRHYTGYVVTEYGTADLYGRSEPERAVELIKIAHPKFREELEKAGRERGTDKEEDFLVLKKERGIHWRMPLSFAFYTHKVCGHGGGNMYLEFTEEQKMLRESVKTFAEKEVAPLAYEIDRDERFPTESFKRLAEMGLLGVTVPAEYGGAGARLHGDVHCRRGTRCSVLFHFCDLGGPLGSCASIISAVTPIMHRRKDICRPYATGAGSAALP